MEEVKRNVTEAAFLRAPLFVWWDVTNRCNFRCLHCYSRSDLDAHETKDLALDEVKGVLNQLSQMGVFHVYFLGGEPFARHDFMDIVRYARSLRLGVMINSNGWFVTERIAQELRRLGVREVRISLDGASPQTHDGFRGVRGAFARATGAVTLLKTAGLEQVCIACTASKYNLDEVGQIVDLAANLGAYNIQVVIMGDCGTGHENYGRLALTTEDSIRLRQVLALKREQYLGRLLVYSVDGVLDMPCTECVQRGTIRPDFMGCRAARTACNITHNGDVIPCLLIREPIAGSLRERTLRDIWLESGVFASWRKKHLMSPECSKCDWADVCIRECPMSPSQLSVESDGRAGTVARVGTRFRSQKACVLTCV